MRQIRPRAVIVLLIKPVVLRASPSRFIHFDPGPFRFVQTEQGKLGIRLVTPLHSLCIWIHISTECRIPICGTFFVNQRHASSIEKRIRRLDEKICSGFSEDGCPILTGICQPRMGACIERRCVTIVDTPVPLPLDSAPIPDGR